MDIAQHVKIAGKTLSLESSDNCKFTRLHGIPAIIAVSFIHG